MPVNDEQRKAITRAVIRLVRKNSGTFHLIGTAIKGFFSGKLTGNSLRPSSVSILLSTCLWKSL